MQDSYLGALSTPLSLNRYLYCLSDPLNLIDPSGYPPALSKGGSNPFARNQSLYLKPVWPQINVTVPLVQTVTPGLAAATTSLAMSNYFATRSVASGSCSAAARFAAMAQTYRQRVLEVSCGSASYVQQSNVTVQSAFPDWLHTGLDMLGMLPGVGAAFDTMNGVLYLAEGNYGEASLSFLSAIPGYGDAIGAVNTARKVATTAFGVAVEAKGAASVFSAFHLGSRPPNLSPSGAGRNGAFNEAKRQNGIPVSQQPSLVGPNVNNQGKVVPGREYTFEIQTETGKQEVTIRDDAAGHIYIDDPTQNRGPHFNGPNNDHYDY